MSAPEIYHYLQGTTTHYPCQQLTELSQQAGQVGDKQGMQGSRRAHSKHEQLQKYRPG